MAIGETWRHRVWQRLVRRLPQLLRFGTVGGFAYVIDVGLMNLLRFGPGELLGHKPLTAKVVSVSVAILFSWLGNRYWAFSDSRRTDRGRELVLFVAVNLGGMLIAVGCLAVSHYLLGFTSALADNISANGVGLVLGTLFRYVCYRYLVFTGVSPADEPPTLDPLAEVAMTEALEESQPAAESTPSRLAGDDARLR